MGTGKIADWPPVVIKLIVLVFSSSSTTILFYPVLQNASRGLAADAFFSSSDLISKATKVSRVAKEGPDNP